MSSSPARCWACAVDDLPLSFFPDIYNEDWFFFAEEAAARRLPRVGQAGQTIRPVCLRSGAGRSSATCWPRALFALWRRDPDLPLAEHLSGATSATGPGSSEARHDVCWTREPPSVRDSPTVTRAAVGSALRSSRWKLRRAYSPTASRPSSVSTSSKHGSRTSRLAESFSSDPRCRQHSRGDGLSGIAGLADGRVRPGRSRPSQGLAALMVGTRDRPAQLQFEPPECGYHCARR